MKTNKKIFLLSLSYMIAASASIIYASTPSIIPFNKISITETESVSSKESLSILSESISLPDTMINNGNKGDWILLEEFNYDRLLSAKTGTEFMDLLYPSGIRLPTMLYDPMDSVRFTSDDLPYESSNGCKLLWLLCANNGEDRLNFTLAEQQAANKYYTLMQLKSISLGLPLYSFIELNPEDTMYTLEQQQSAKRYVDFFEQHFGTIYFIDTAKLEYDWCSEIQSKEFITKKKVLHYPIPKGSKTIQLYTNYRNYFDALQFNGISGNTDISNFLTEDEIKVNYNNFTEVNVGSSFIDSVLLLGKYFEQLPLDLYDIIFIGRNESVETITNVATPFGENKGVNAADTVEKKEKKQTNDPYFTALRNQTVNTFDRVDLSNISNNENSIINIKAIYQNICLIIFCVGLFVIIILYFLNKTKGQ